MYLFKNRQHPNLEAMCFNYFINSYSSNKYWNDNSNRKYWPTAFYDGGEHVVVGGGAGVEHHRNLIEESGKRDVHELDLTLSVDYLGSGEMDISISITNNL